MPDKLLTTRQVQEYLNVDRITVYRMVESGQIPGMKVGGQWRFSQSAIDEWLHSRSGKAQSSLAAAPAPLEPSEALTLASRPLDALRVADLVAPSCLEIIQGSFAQALGVAVGITDLAGSLLVPMSNSCGYCQAGRFSAAFRQGCQASWAALATAREPEPRVHTCHAGLLYATSPVRVGDQRLGMVVVDQFRDVPPDEDFLRHARRVALDCGLDPDRMESLAREARVLAADRVDLATKLLLSIAGALSEIANQNYQVRNKLAQIARIVGTA